ncbi:MAG: DinB family protein [candidate division Zixibacteria bacterium]|nr:DinB family protein [candidate division Zixibacteria bacterium]
MSRTDDPGLQSLVATWEYARQWTADSIKDMTREELLFRPGEGRNHAWWLYGHIVVSSDISPLILEAEPVVPKEWRKFFDMETKPDSEGRGYPEREALIEMFNRVVDANIKIIKNLEPKQLAERPTDVAPKELAEYFSDCGKIIGGFALHVVYHSGQIMTIRRLLGK